MTSRNGTRRGRKRLVFVTSNRRKALESIGHATVCRSVEHCVQLLREGSNAIWVSLSNPILFRALRRWTPRAGEGRRLRHLLLLDESTGTGLPLLRTLFREVTGGDGSFRFLPREELIDVLSAPEEEARDLFIGGAVDEATRVIVIVRGDLSRVVAPFSVFAPSGRESPDFGDLGFGDYGRTVHLGPYEAASDAILYDLDSDFRRRLRARRRAEDKGFGGSLRRLRKQLGIKRTEFSGVTDKTIARIERGETIPRARTLKSIENRLGMSEDEIATY